MLSLLPGIVLVLVITVVAGGIAYIGDRVGHQVGRKRLTLFGLRPKYTSTIVAVATGMLIALSVTLAALAASGYVRTAFFRLGQLNAQMNALQAQTIAAEKQLERTRNSNIVLAKYSLIAPYGRVIDPGESHANQLAALSALFDETVNYANATYVNANFGLLPIRKTSADPAVQRDLAKSLADARERALQTPGHGDDPLFFVPVAYQNMFRGETIALTFAAYADFKLAAPGQALAAVDVEGGKPLSQLTLQQLYAQAVSTLGRRGFPAPFIASPANGFDPTRVQQVGAEVARLRGRFRLTASSENDLYPHSGQFILTVSLVPRR